MTEATAQDSPATIIGGVGATLRHDSAIKHVTGAATYIDDMPEIAGTLHAFLVKSPLACGELRGIDTAEALQSPGVVTIATVSDIPGINDIAPIIRGEPLLAKNAIEFVGHPIACVVAESFAAARDAAALVKIDIAEHTPVLTIAEALAAESYVAKPQVMKRGDAQRAIDKAPHRLNGKFSIGGQDHFYLEGQIALAVPQEDRDMLVYSSTQNPTEVQHGVARVLGLALGDVAVEVRRMGGGFGGKESQATIVAALAALCADKTGRPVKLRLNRDDDMIVTGKRHDFLVAWTVGFDDSGRIAGLDMKLASRAGNVADHSPSVMTRALCHIDNCYHLPAAYLHGYVCKTNTVSNTAFRGYGGPQGIIAAERMIEDIARHLGKAPDDVRRINYYGTATGNTTPYGQRVLDNIIKPLVDSLWTAAEMDKRRAEVDRFNAANDVIKKGIALSPVKFGVSFNMPTLNQGGALIHVYTDGSIHLNHGGTEMGQGLFVKVAQVVAEVFQIDVDHVKISATRTDKVPNTSPTAGSVGSDLNGAAAQNAAEQIKKRLIGVAAKEFGVAKEAVSFTNNKVVAGNHVMEFADVAQLAWVKRVSLSAAGYYKTPKVHWNGETMTGHPFYYFAYGAAISEVAIDTLTGETRVLRTDILHDCGSSINPALDMGQIEGAFVQGQGWLTTEELWWDERGDLKTHAPSTYKIPGSRDVPPVLRVHILEDAPNREPTVFRSKAVGEPPLMLAISVWLAIRDAVASLSRDREPIALDAPATPERILMAVDAIRAKATAH